MESGYEAKLEIWLDKHRTPACRDIIFAGLIPDLWQSASFANNCDSHISHIVRKTMSLAVFVVLAVILQN